VCTAAASNAATAAAFRPLHFAAAVVCLSGGMHTAADTAAAFRPLQYAAVAGGVGAGVCALLLLLLQPSGRCTLLLPKGVAAGVCALLLLLLLLLHLLLVCLLLNYACSCLGCWPSARLAWQVPANC
jgi:hypothetical protein